MKRLSFNNAIWLRFLCAISMLFAAFAHQPASFAQENIDLSAYTLPDGSLPSLCLSGADEDGHAVEIPCEFCRMSGGVLLPDEMQSNWLLCIRQTKEAEPIPSTRLVKQLFLPSAPLRGPPSA